MAGLLNIGITGLNAAQAGLLTTGHNISNAGTAGYTRQSVRQTTNDPLFSGAGFFGQGTRVSGITRSYSQFLENQVLAADNRRAEFSSYHQQIAQINNMMADPEAGLSPMMQGFFAGVQEVAANPSSVAARQAMISAAQALTSRFQAMNTRLSEVRQGVEGEIGGAVSQINGYAASIAEMNQRILVAQSAGSDIPANDLLDQRNQLVAELNQLIKVSTTVESNGSLSVFIGSGQSLVLGQQVSRLGATPSQNDPTRAAVSLIAPNGNAIELPESVLTGGKLGGLLAFRRDSLDTAQNQLGLIAVGMAEAFNAQHRLGQDLDGVLGSDFFKSPTATVRPAGAASVAFDPAQLGRLTASDYQLINEGGGNFTLIRLADRTRVVDNAPLPASVDGLQISVGSLAAGETALIQPTRFAARDIEVAITDTRKLAAGNPVSGTVPLANTGNGRIENILVRNVTGMTTAPATAPNFGPITLTYDAGTGAFSVTPPASATIAPATFDAAADSVGKRFTLTSASGFQFDFTVAGSPKSGDQFVFAPTERGVADNRNAAQLGALQTRKILFSSGTGEPTATFQSSYAQVVSSVGNKTREVQVGEKAQEVLLQQATDSRDALSGVNLDEEAANLMRYQQAYQAAGRVMSIAQRLFDEVLSIAR